MQFAVAGRVVHSRAVRWAVAAGWILALSLVALGAHRVQGRPDLLTPGLALTLAGSLGGCISEGRVADRLARPFAARLVREEEGLVHLGHVAIVVRTLAP